MLKRSDGAYISYDQLAAELESQKAIFDSVLRAIQDINHRMDVLQNEISSFIDEVQKMNAAMKSCMDDISNG
jgi:predicted  nucleic acid-binding Zn-ribbon protein